MNDPNKIIAWGTIVLGVVGIGSLWLTCQSVNIARRTLEDSEKSFRQDQRAYL
jgi:hypothetical protein